MQGLEFMVTQDPSENDTKQIHSGVWVIRKQMRRKRPSQADEIIPLQSYFIVAETIYAAPSVESVLKGRLVSLFARSAACSHSKCSYLQSIV